MPDATSSDSQPARIIVLVGLPGSGKSTYLEKLGATALSSDHIRWLLVDDATDQSIHRDVFATVRYLLRRRLQLKRPATYIDATNLTRKDRRAYIKMGDLYGCRVEAVYFDVPIEVCKERNRGRTRVVPEEAIEMLAARLQVPSIEEGFASVTRIGLEGLPAAAAREPEPTPTVPPAQ